MNTKAICGLFLNPVYDCGNKLSTASLLRVAYHNHHYQKKIIEFLKDIL